MVPLVVFVHTALLPRCQQRIDQYLSLMKASGLLDVLTQLYIDCVGDGQLPSVAAYSSYPITVERVSSVLEDNEFPTQHHLWSYARDHPTSFLLYLHTKGVGKEINPAIEDWVSYMTYFLIEQWQSCVKELESNKTVGVDLRPEFHLHYSGNFWWTRADFVRLLPNPLEFRDLTRYPNAIQSWRHNAEFWICYDGLAPGHVNLWSSNIHVGMRHLCLYPRDRYATCQ